VKNLLWKIPTLVKAKLSHCWHTGRHHMGKIYYSVNTETNTICNTQGKHKYFHCYDKQKSQTRVTAIIKGEKKEKKNPAAQIAMQ
jgi:hypothetical protein